MSIGMSTTGMDVFRSLIIAYLFLAFGLVAGVILSRVESGGLVGVRNLIDEVDLFFRGHPEERTSAMTKVLSEFGGQARIDRSTTDTTADLKTNTFFKLADNLELAASAPLPGHLAMAMFVSGYPDGHLIIASGKSDRVLVRRFRNAVDFFIDEEEIIFLRP